MGTWTAPPGITSTAPCATATESTDSPHSTSTRTVSRSMSITERETWENFKILWRNNCLRRMRRKQRMNCKQKYNEFSSVVHFKFKCDIPTHLHQYETLRHSKPLK